MIPPPLQFPDLLIYPRDGNHNQGCSDYVDSPATDCCHDWSHISNNLMGGSSYDKTLTPDQISQIHNDLESFLSPYIDHCECPTNPTASFELSPSEDCMYQNQGIFVDARNSTNYGSYDIQICEVASVNSTSCLGNNYDSGWQNGQIPGPTQTGAIDLTKFYNFVSSNTTNKYYMVKLTVDNSQCPGPNTDIQYFTSLKCNYPLKMSYAPNPATNTVTVDYTLDKKSTLSISLYDQTGIQSGVVQPMGSTEAGHYVKTFDVGKLPSGQHYIVVMLDGKSSKFPLVVHH